MGRILAISTLAFAFGLTALAPGLEGDTERAAPVQQGGNMGRVSSEDAARAFDRAVSTYLNGDEVKSILTPGEFNELKLDGLKAGQVVFAEARSDAFDPGLEIVDSSGKVLAENDDRYPGDQRPLLSWRCEHDGNYAIHIRCFQNKAGGQFFMRFKTWDSIDLSSGQPVEKEVDTSTPFLLRVPMKAGQMKTFVSEHGRFMGFYTGAVIAPGGLPDIDLTRQISPVTGSFMAPVDGTYYVIANPEGSDRNRATIRAIPREVVAQKLISEGGALVAKAPTNSGSLWELTVKAGDLLEVSAPELSLNPRFILSEIPDISKFKLDPKKPELNPFYPPPRDKAPEYKGPSHDILPARARDNRLFVFYARRDTKLWLASDGSGRPDSQYTLKVRRAWSVYGDEEPNKGKLRIGSYDYWAFDAQSGDVMTLGTTATGFSEQVVVRDPGLGELRHSTAGVDQMSDGWKMVVQRPGRYLVSVSCMGDGGGGDYSLTRKVLHAKTFAKGSPAASVISDGEIQVWKFTATPNDPLLIHWKSTGGYSASIYDERGNPTDIQRESVDGQNQFGILKVREQRTFVIVLTGTGGKASYSISLNDIPGYRAGR